LVGVESHHHQLVDLPPPLGGVEGGIPQSVGVPLNVVPGESQLAGDEICRRRRLHGLRRHEGAMGWDDLHAIVDREINARRKRCLVPGVEVPYEGECGDASWAQELDVGVPGMSCDDAVSRRPPYVSP
jgi:hypothetical protein